MRYISHISNLILFRNDGTVAYRFGDDGVLKVGNLTTNVGSGNAIDASLHSDSKLDLMRVFKTDLDGNTITSIEMCGQGSLTSVSATGNPLTVKSLGYRYFFEAPILTGGASVSGVLGVRYRVLTGTVTYKGITYKVGEYFDTDGSVTTTGGTGTFALDIPADLAKIPTDNRSALFRERSLLFGDEAYTNWSFTNAHGAEPYDSLTSTDPNYIGWRRP